MPHQCTSCSRQFADGSKEMLSGCPDCGGSKFQFMPNGGAPAAEEPPSPPERGTGTVTETVGHVATKLRDFVGDDPGPPKRRSSGSGGAAPGGTSSGDGNGSPGGEGNRPPGGAGGGATAAAAAQVETDADASPDGATDRQPGTVDEASTELESDRNTGDSPESVRTEDALQEPQSDGDVDDEIDDEATERPDTGGSIEESAGPEDGAQSTARSQMVSPDELPDGPAWPGTEVEDDVQPATDPDAEAEGRVVDTPESETPDLAQLREELNDQFEGIRITEPGQYELNLMELYEREETIIALQENGRYVIEPPESWRGDDSA